MIVSDAKTRGAALSLNPKNLIGTPGDAGGLLACPACDDEYVHIRDVAVDLGSDESDSRRPVRGTITTLYCECESGGHRFALKFGFHKGNTFVWAELFSGPRR